MTYIYLLCGFMAQGPKSDKNIVLIETKRKPFSIQTEKSAGNKPQ